MNSQGCNPWNAIAKRLPLEGSPQSVRSFFRKRGNPLRGWRRGEIRFHTLKRAAIHGFPLWGMFRDLREKNKRFKVHAPFPRTRSSEDYSRMKRLRK